jgi:hypothetical protein
MVQMTVSGAMGVSPSEIGSSKYGRGSNIASNNTYIFKSPMSITSEKDIEKFKDITYLL